MGLFRSPLARWGFTVLAVLALTSSQTIPFLITAALATYAWRNRPHRPRRR
jgi:hypothetical protein